MTKTKYQVALDSFSLDDAVKFVRTIEDYIDIIEIGTPLVIDEGMHAVRRMIKEFPNKEVLSDEKIMDGGYHEADLGYQAGAKYVTVLGVAEDKTIQGCLDAAHDADAILVVDTLKIPNLAERAKEVEAMGVHFISVHTGFDQQQMGRTPLNDLRIVKANTNSIRVSVAGGINSKTIDQYLALKPDVVIMGGGLADADDPVDEARKIREAIEKHETEGSRQ